MVVGRYNKFAFVLLIVVSIGILFLNGCSQQSLEVDISDVYILRNNYINEGLIFDTYIAEIILENKTTEKINFIDKHVEDAQGRSYKANFTYEEEWGKSCASTCSSDAKFLDAEIIKPGYFEIVGEVPVDATVLRAYIQTELDLLVFSLPAPDDIEIREVILELEDE